MKTSDLIAHVKELPYFSRADLRVFDLPEKNIEIYLGRAVISGKLYRLKRGIYTSKSYVEQIASRNYLAAYKEFLANVIVASSYLSTAYILSKYELMSEAVYSMTSITTGRPTLITNYFGNYRYRNTSNEILSEFETIQEGPLQIKRANKIQALFDYLYLKKKELKVITPEIVKELRLNIHLLSSEEFEALELRVEKSRSRKLAKIVQYLKESC